MKESLAIVHGGAPTAVMNASLYGAIREAKESGAFRNVYGARGGSGGLLRGEGVQWRSKYEVRGILADLGRLPLVRRGIDPVGNALDALVTSALALSAGPQPTGGVAG